MTENLSWSEARDELRRFRENNTRFSERVIELWEDVICDSQHRLGDEIWVVLEQVCVAAIDCAQEEVFRDCIKELDGQFPESHRVKRLKGMREESRENFKGAESIYDSILNEDPTNSLVKKRKIAMFRTQNRLNEAIAELSQYLKTFMNDLEAWQELCDLYLKVQEYTKAGHAMEELIISHPHHHLYQQRYAEILYTLGGTENFELARSYFANAVKLSNQTNMRALYGLMLTANSLASNPKANPKAKQDNRRYAAWARDKIRAKHQEALPNHALGSKCEEAMMECLETMLEEMQLGGSAPQMS